MPDEYNAPLKSSFNFGKGVLIVAMVSALILFFIMDFDRYLSFEALRENREQMKDWYHEHYLMTVVLFILTYTLVVALSFPGAIWMTLAGGFIFGPVQAFLLVIVSATLGASTVFVLAQFCFVDFF